MDCEQEVLPQQGPQDGSTIKAIREEVGLGLGTEGLGGGRVCGQVSVVCFWKTRQRLWPGRAEEHVEAGRTWQQCIWYTVTGETAHIQSHSLKLRLKVQTSKALVWLSSKLAKSASLSGAVC